MKGVFWVRLEVFVGLTDRYGNPFEWNRIYPKLARKIANITFATVFKDLQGIYKNRAGKLILEDSVMFLMMIPDEEAEVKIEKLKEIFKWFLKETNQETVLFVKNLTEFELIKNE